MEFLAKYHGNGSRDHPIVQLEWKQLKENIKLNASDKRWWDYVGVSTYEKRSYRLEPPSPNSSRCTVPDGGCSWSS